MSGVEPSGVGGSASAHDDSHVAVPAVVRMGEDIVRQFAHLGHHDATVRAAAHIGMFWEPRMRAELAALLDTGRLDDSPLLRDAAARVAVSVGSRSRSSR